MAPWRPEREAAPPLRSGLALCAGRSYFDPHAQAAERHAREEAGSAIGSWRSASRPTSVSETPASAANRLPVRKLQAPRITAATYLKQAASDRADRVEAPFCWLRSRAPPARARRTNCVRICLAYTARHLVAAGRQRIIVSGVSLTDPPQRPKRRWFCLLLQD